MSCSDAALAHSSCGNSPGPARSRTVLVFVSFYSFSLGFCGAPNWCRQVVALPASRNCASRPDISGLAACIAHGGSGADGRKIESCHPPPKLLPKLPPHWSVFRLLNWCRTDFELPFLLLRQLTVHRLVMTKDLLSPWLRSLGSGPVRRLARPRQCARLVHDGHRIPQVRF